MCVQSKGSIRSGENNDFDKVYKFRNPIQLHPLRLSEWHRIYERTNVFAFPNTNIWMFFQILPHQCDWQINDSLFFSPSLLVVEIDVVATECHQVLYNWCREKQLRYFAAVACVNIFLIHFGWHCSPQRKIVSLFSIIPTQMQSNRHVVRKYLCLRRLCHDTRSLKKSQHEITRQNVNNRKEMVFRATKNQYVVSCTKILITRSADEFFKSIQTSENLIERRKVFATFRALCLSDLEDTMEFSRMWFLEVENNNHRQ